MAPRNREMDFIQLPEECAVLEGELDMLARVANNEAVRRHREFRTESRVGLGLVALLGAGSSLAGLSAGVVATVVGTGLGFVILRAVNYWGQQALRLSYFLGDQALAIHADALRAGRERSTEVEGRLAATERRLGLSRG